ncbi:pantoate--beta-alanine ligase [uncultured Brevibacterium sp.]|uniref:pantoate--beta-alanine ligase n=1 Tax=uncultured Brevibacterium sp. TaxID=189678 RepID=UPI0025FF1680|nr:pantoate--beta-alanine ligase [uncultured Brevibacterium sp.]
MTVLTRTIAELRSALTRLVAEREAHSVGLVPTMGALHQGHAALMRAARADNPVVCASLFVNPLQFESPLDLELYPRDLDADMALCEAEGVDLVLAPEVEEMYPNHPDSPIVRVTSGHMGQILEGASRPGHFDGVATVVSKLFNIFDPEGPARLKAYFGQKDAQQLMIVSRMVADLDFPVTIVPVPTQREESGLALSSRNLLLTEEHRQAATALSSALFELRDRAAHGADWDLSGLRRQVREAPDVILDYLEVVAPGTLLPTESLPALALIAAYVGSVRLIDNIELPAH